MGVRSIILTSGTLSPMKSFAFELETDFQVELENTHVIKPEQVCIGVLPKGLKGREFCFNYNQRDNDAMLEDLGESLLTVVERAPDGMLIFFPSYTLMSRTKKIWDQKGITDKMEKYKAVYEEPRISSRFKAVRRNFEEDVNNHGGAILMGVCRGKISEGLDFSDRAARCVVIIGMPFAQWKDPKVQLKMEYLNKKCSKGISHINGRDWYNQEASRAVNQAIGRVIRHINDYGLILLVDKRYGEYRVKNERSKWLRERQVTFNNFDTAATTIEEFFENMKNLKLPPKKIREPRLFDSSDEGEDYIAKSLRQSGEAHVLLKNCKWMFLTEIWQFNWNV